MDPRRSNFVWANLAVNAQIWRPLITTKLSATSVSLTNRTECWQMEKPQKRNRSMALSQILDKLRLQQEPICFGIVRGILKFVDFPNTLSRHPSASSHKLDLWVALSASEGHHFRPTLSPVLSNLQNALGTRFLGRQKSGEPSERFRYNPSLSALFSAPRLSSFTFSQ